MPRAKPSTNNDEALMRQALELAHRAAAQGEVPVGALVVDGDGRVWGQGLNLRESRHDPLAHAEALALKQASRQLGRWRLSGCTLYVTLEPCVMCAGAIVLSRVDRVVFGATDPKAGAVQSLYSILADPRLNHRPEVLGGVLADECSAVLKDFFAARRG